MHRIGKTPNFGIDAPEEGLFVSTVEYTPSCETYEQLDIRARYGPCAV